MTSRRRRQATAEAIGLGRPLTDAEIELVDGYAAGIYGIPDAEGAAWRRCPA